MVVPVNANHFAYHKTAAAGGTLPVLYIGPETQHGLIVGNGHAQTPTADNSHRGRIEVRSEFNQTTVLIDGRDRRRRGRGQTLWGGRITVSGDGGAVVIDGATGDIRLPGRDCSEEFEASDADLKPGEVVSVDGKGLLRRSSGEEDASVVGVVSGLGDRRPGLVLGNDDSHQPSNRWKPVAIAGTVNVITNDLLGPISVGALLAPSPVPGQAGRASEAMAGRIIGKVLTPPRRGVTRMLVMAS